VADARGALVAAGLSPPDRVAGQCRHDRGHGHRPDDLGHLQETEAAFHGLDVLVQALNVETARLTASRDRALVDPTALALIARAKDEMTVHPHEPKPPRIP
jgi:hypothetical protein